MKRWLFAFMLTGLLALMGCSRSAETETAEETPAMPEETAAEEETSGIKVIEGAGENNDRTVSVRIVDGENPALPGQIGRAHV